MKLLRLSALTIALFSFTGAQAEESDHKAETSAVPAAQIPWSSFDEKKSTLLSQARAVFAVIRRTAEPEGEIEVIRMATNVPDETNSEFCRHMGTPGSRIMTRRCFNRTPSEAAFDDFQYQAEIDENIRLQTERFLENADDYSVATGPGTSVY